MTSQVWLQAYTGSGHTCYGVACSTRRGLLMAGFSAAAECRLSVVSSRRISIRSHEIRAGTPSSEPPSDGGNLHKSRPVDSNREGRNLKEGDRETLTSDGLPRFSRVQGLSGGHVEAERDTLEGGTNRRLPLRSGSGDADTPQVDDECEEGADRTWSSTSMNDRPAHSGNQGSRTRNWKQQRRSTDWGSELLARRDPAFDMAVVSQITSGQLSVTVRVLYSLAMYCGMALVGKFICDAAGVDIWGGFRLNAENFYSALLYALLPIFGSLVLHQDSVVESWAPARAIRDVEEEELEDFFVGMAGWQYCLIGSVASIAEEVFFRSAVQGGLAHAMQVTSKGVTETTFGMAAITGVIPTIIPCSQAMAAVLTAAITGSMFYVISTPKDPKVVVARGSPREMRKSLGAWHERQKLKKIYSPLLESLLSLYLSFEWIATGNLMAPIVTHALYYISSVSTGVRRIEDRERDLMSRRRLMSKGKDKGHGSVARNED